MRIYLDYNATTPLRPSVKEALLASMDLHGNPSSVHFHGRELRKRIEAARSTLADYFNVHPKQVIFTSGATEANTLVLKGFSGQVIVSAIEHRSILQTLDHVDICPVDENGLIDLAFLDTFLQHSSKPTLVSCMLANNETGVIQPLKDVVSLAKKYEAFTHCDATQAKISVDWSSLNLDFISFSSHKIGGPQGVGALIINPDIVLRPLFRGGGQERSYRAGTENVLGIIGFGQAIDVCRDEDWQEIETLRDCFEEHLLKNFPEITIFGKKVDRLPNTTNFSMPGVKSDIQVMTFDLKGISVSAGSACSSGKVQPSHVLKAMGVSQEISSCALRLSLGWQTTEQDMQKTFEICKDIYTRSQDLCL
ncbi:MAG: cysteine desulfurase [Proteobacteria bacterium]|nr:cysteine desulfurase [Pseudomonadota bacterium]